jgi:hypothetical protein
MDVKSLLIGALLVTAIVLGFLYYESEQTRVKVDLGGVKIEGR